MTKKELIEELKQYPDYYEVKVVSHRAVVQSIEKIYLGKKQQTKNKIIIRG